MARTGRAIERCRPRRLLLALALLALQACGGGAGPPLPAGLGASPLVLTFELSDDGDAVGIRALALDRPATYFLAGALAERHPELVRELAGRGTLGSLGHAEPDLTRLGPEALHRELLLGKLVLERAAGRPVEWFRSPALASSPAVVREAARVGFRYDSSDLERWPRQFRLHALPVSTEDGGERPASDHALLDTAGLADAEAVAWLVARYEERAVTGRPLVLALRPRLIAARRAVLDGIVAHVERRGGELLTAQAYVERAMRVRPRRWGVWVDLGQGPHDAAQLARDVEAAGITDVFLQAKDPDGNRYYPAPGDGGPVPRAAFAEALEALRPTGVRVHAWIAVARDPYLAQRHREWAMTGLDGARSPDWIAPSHPGVRAAVRRTVAELLDRFPLAGVHLDYLRYPGFDHDFGADAVARFRRAAGLGDVPDGLRAMFDLHYNAWVGWRCQQVTGLAAEVADLLAARRGPPVELSAALYADAATSYRVMEAMGQDYAALARHLHLVVPMAYIKEHERPVDWISKVALAARYRAGTREVLAGLEAYQRPPRVAYDPATFRAALEAAGEGYAGQVFYAYSFLFGRDRSEANMPPGSLEALRAVRAALGEPSRRASRFPWVVYPIAALAFAIAAAAAARGRAVRARRRRAGTSPARRAAVEPARLDPEWQRIERDGRAVEDRERIDRLLGAVTPSAVEQLRAAYLIESLGERGVAEPDLVAALGGLPLGRAQVLEVLERAGQVGAVELRDGVLRATSRGRADVEAARAGGYRRTTWRLVETLLAAARLRACPSCGAPNLPARPGAAPGCVRCGFPL